MFIGSVGQSTQFSYLRENFPRFLEGRTEFEAGEFIEFFVQDEGFNKRCSSGKVRNQLSKILTTKFTIRYRIVERKNGIYRVL